MFVVINDGIGGFGVSQLVFEKLIQLGWSVSTKWESDTEIYEHNESDLKEFDVERYVFRKNNNDPSIRSHPDLISLVRKLGEKANGENANLKIVEIPDGVKFGIGENEMGYE